MPVALAFVDQAHPQVGVCLSDEVVQLTIVFRISSSNSRHTLKNLIVNAGNGDCLGDGRAVSPCAWLASSMWVWTIRRWQLFDHSAIDFTETARCASWPVAAA
ncbi:hypothetical protein [Catellatospora methionotrophica]|uniref:hypothetical protein n=1 Tax=Catellatospora methionotrophica TaxID=121620 RepID=UPI0033EB2DF6